MHGLPADFDPSVFVGAEVTAVCISANTAEIHFDLDRLIKLEASFAYGEDGSSLDDLTVPADAAWLANLPGKAVVTARSQSGGDLRLGFDDGQVVVCVDDSPTYESYSIKIGDREIFV